MLTDPVKEGSAWDGAELPKWGRQFYQARERHF